MEKIIRVVGAVVLYRLYDVGYEIDLERALDFLAVTPEDRETLRLNLERRQRVEAQAIRIKNPPITVTIGTEPFDAVGRHHDAQVSARIFDFGVISLRMRCDIPGAMEWGTVAQFGDSADLSRAARAGFERAIEELTGRIAPAIARPQIAPVSEDYVVYRFTRVEDGGGQALPASVLRELDVAPLLLNEDRPISEQARKELLPHWFSYYPDDLSIITWSTALVLDPMDGESDVQLILEFANAQLLELRYYDALLDAELPRMYDRIENARKGSGALLGRRYAGLLTGLQTLLADSTEIVERTQNALKVTDDIFLARVYAAALELFRERAWRTGIDHKLGIIHQTYEMLNAEAMAVRNEVLEVTIVVLIVVEIVLAILMR
ncbi:MAG TPA: hypothetical protein VFP39_10325 [Gemmatimonadales bacterium]|nr:hypothetical protein [Gemmatimonadales bacterium]